jgi:hypothetical protein
MFNEQSPLLGRQKSTPLPLFQFALILFLQLAEPLSSQVIYPFAPKVLFSAVIYRFRRLKSCSLYGTSASLTVTRLGLATMSGSWYGHFTFNPALDFKIVILRSNPHFFSPKHSQYSTGLNSQTASAANQSY